MVDLLLTDDPLIAGNRTKTGIPWLYQNVTLDASGQAQLNLSRVGKPALNGEMLYAVVNPYGKQRESDSQ